MTAPVIGKYCGRKIPPTIYSSSGALFVRFVTDDWKEEAGWSAVYSDTLSGKILVHLNIAFVYKKLLFLNECT